MEFYIDLVELQNALKILRASVKSTSTESSGVLSIVIQQDNVLTLHTTDGYIGTLYTATTANVVTIGSVGVLHTELTNFVGQLKPLSGAGGVDIVHFKLTPKHLSVTVENVHNNKKYKLNRKLKLFNEVPTINLNIVGDTTSLDTALIKYAIDKTASFVDPLHPIVGLRGVYLSSDDTYFFFTATNGIILSEYKMEKPANSTLYSCLFSYEFIKGLRGVISVLAKDAASVASLSVSDKLVKVAVNNVVFWGSLIFGQKYPEYKKEIDKAFKHKFVINRQLFLDNLLPIIGALDEDDNNRLTISVKGATVRLYNDMSEAFFEIDSSDTEDFIVDVNGRLCKELISNIHDDSILMLCSDDKSNVIFDSAMFQDQKTLLTFLRRRSL